MPNIKSAIKRVQIAERNRIRNRKVKSTIKTAIRSLQEEVNADKDSEKVPELLNKCNSLIDKAVSKGVYHKNTASRKKSRLANFVKKSKETQEQTKK